MTNLTDNPADPFKKALAEATKVMADDPELSVSFTVDPPGATTFYNEVMRLGCSSSISAINWSTRPW